MAVPGIRNHRKFRRLRSILKDLPDVYIEAHLNAMWTPAYQSANPDLGEECDVELAAEWEESRRPAGQWFKAVLKAGFIDEVTHDNAGNAGVRYCVHDLFDWCPPWVLDKAEKSGERRKEKTCNACGEPYRSSEPHSKYCSNSCRQKAFKRKEKITEVTQGNAGNAEVTKPSVSVTQGNELPSPPLPSPISIYPTETSQSGVVGGIPVDPAFSETVRESFSAWAIFCGKRPIMPMHNDHLPIKAMLENFGAAERARVLPALEVCRKSGKPFNNPKYAIGVVRGVIEQNQDRETKNGHAIAKPDAPRRRFAGAKFDNE